MFRAKAFPRQQIHLASTMQSRTRIGRLLNLNQGIGAAYQSMSIVDASELKQLDLQIEVPVENMARLGENEDTPERGSIAGTCSAFHLDRHFILAVAARFNRRTFLFDLCQ